VGWPTALLGLGLAMSCAHGWTRWLMPGPDESRLARALTTLGLSVGGVTLAMLGGLALAPGVSVGLSAMLGIALIGGTGAWLARRAPPARRAASLPVGDWTLIVPLTLMAAVVGVAILLDAAYWPFAPGDALAIYAPQAKALYETGRLPEGEGLYEAYPMLGPMAYAYGFWAYGGPHEQVARTIAAILGVAAIATAGALASTLRGAAAGAGAAALVAMTPVFSVWATTGYVDAPAAFYVGLATLHLWRWWTYADRRTAALAGVAAGLAMWTKNAALTLVVSLALVGAARWWRAHAAQRAAVLRQLAILGGVTVLTAGPWYARNLLTFGVLVPDTIWTHLVDHSPRVLLAMADPRRRFAPPGWLYTAALAYGLGRLAWPRDSASDGGRARFGLCAAVVIPFLAAWWWLASYDTRFLLLILPVLAAMAALMLAELAQFSGLASMPGGTRRATGVAITLAALALPLALRAAVEHKWGLLAGPFLDGETKREMQLGGLPALARAVNQLPAGCRVINVPPMARYYVDAGRLDVSFGEARSPRAPSEFAAEADFVALRLTEEPPVEWARDGRLLLRTRDGYALYRTRGDGTGC
jgi:dolichyl-phosphate-mannose-protein mannosyltransferase